MPYHVIPYKNGFVVANQNTGKHYSKHAMSKEMAERQMKAMYMHLRAPDIRPQHHIGRPINIRPQDLPSRPYDIIAHLNPHLKIGRAHV